MSKSRRRKSSSMKTTIVAILIGAVGAIGYKVYSGYLFGTYQCDKFYESMKFYGEHKADITIMGIKSAWKYEVAGKKVILTSENNESIVFTKENGKLVTQALVLGRITCQR